MSTCDKPQYFANAADFNILTSIVYSPQVKSTGVAMTTVHLRLPDALHRVLKAAR